MRSVVDRNVVMLRMTVFYDINPLNAELNPICHLLALLGGATIVVVSRLRVNCAFVGSFIQYSV